MVTIGEMVLTAGSLVIGDLAFCLGFALAQRLTYLGVPMYTQQQLFLAPKPLQLRRHTSAAGGVEGWHLPVLGNTFLVEVCGPGKVGGLLNPWSDPGCSRTCVAQQSVDACRPRCLGHGPGW